MKCMYEPEMKVVDLKPKQHRLEDEYGKYAQIVGFLVVSMLVFVGIMS